MAVDPADPPAPALEGASNRPAAGPGSVRRPATRSNAMLLWAELDHPGLPRHLPATELSLAGVYLTTDAPPPPLATSLVVSLASPRGRVRLPAEVARQVGPEEAALTGRRPGFAVRFTLLDSARFASLTNQLGGAAPPP